LGRRGEDLAVRHLRSLGAKVLARNYRCPQAEVDLIVLDRSTRREHGAETIAFVEVKTRSSDFHTDPQSAVDAGKQRRIRQAAEHYLAHHAAAGFRVRFDVVAVLVPPDGPVEVNHIPEAF
jgi:putative endonuclease